MSVSELNELMTYVVEGWMLFSAGFISTTFIAFVSKRIQEDIAAAELAQAETLTEGVSSELSESATETVDVPVKVPVAESVEVSATAPAAPDLSEGSGEDAIATDDEEAARLEEVAAVSNKLAKEKQKQSGSSSVSVST